MPEKTDLNITPYFDDYSEDKLFHKVLYRAGRPLQARELTQSQSILQNQIERLGDHFFEEGSIVSGAQSDVDMDIYYVKVDSANPNGSGDTAAESYREASHDKYYQGQTTGVIAKVFYSSAQTTTDSLTLYVRFQSQGTGTGNEAGFAAGENLRQVTVNANGVAADVGDDNNDFEIVATAATGRSSIANISEGIMFLRGFFCKIDAQTLILDKYSGKPSYRVGLTITEELIGSAVDQSLLDNAQGTSNENAAGADRLKLSLTLSKYSLESVEDANFVELIRVNQGILELKITNPQYSEIENTFARRAFDAHGDFVVRQFTPSLREHLNDTTNQGFYTKAYGGNDDYFLLQISPGKAYVRGYEIDKVGTTNLTLPKARTTVSLDNLSTPLRLGNKLRVTNAYGLPDFGADSANVNAFGLLKLFDANISSQGSENAASGHIGYARVREIDFQSGTGTYVTAGKYIDANSVFNLLVFDVKMFTKLTGAITNTYTVGDKITGATSGATGIVGHQVSTTDVFVHDVLGTFVVGETLSDDQGNASSAALSAVKSYNLDVVRGCSEDSGTAANFTANVKADKDVALTGSVSIATNGAISGYGTNLAVELNSGDIIIDGGGTEQTINTIASDGLSAQTVATSGVGALSNGNLIRRRAALGNQDQTVSIYAWPRDWVKTHSPDSVQVKRQSLATISAGGTATVETGANGTFVGAATGDRDYLQLAVMELAGGSPTLALGDVLDLSDVTWTKTVSDLGTGLGQRLIISGLGNANVGVKVKISYGASYTGAVNRDKTIHKGRCLSVESASGSFYGVGYEDKDISLGVADAYKIRGIYEGVDGTPLPPNTTLTSVTGTFQVYETIVGQTSGARAIILKVGSGTPTYYYYTNADKFSDGEVVVGQTSVAYGTTGTAAGQTLSQGSPNITSRYYFDDGQRDGFYDTAKISLKPGAPIPTNKILIVFDYFTGSGGQFYDVESYPVEYKDIPVYSPNKVDLGGNEPDGTYELSDAVDFRPSVGQVLGTATFGTGAADPAAPINLSNSTSGATVAPFAYVTGRTWSGTGASVLDTPLPGGSLVGDISFYVPRIDKVFLHQDGIFQIATGNPELSPTRPKALDGGMEMFQLNIPAFTKNLQHVKIRSQDHRRFTMKDIGKINNRLTNIERITSLSLLEKDTQALQILDADGFDRYKSGFLVDNFRGHKIGDVNHPDYNVGIDTKLGLLRPKSYSQYFDIELNTTNSSNYQQTGNLITLPYSQISYVNQDKASRAINVNPYHVFAFIGDVLLSPETDIWQDTDQLPTVRINREGNYDAVLAENVNSLGTIWNAWQTTWVGEPSVVSNEVQASSSGSWSGDPSQGGEWVSGLEITREITDTPENQTRNGVTTSVVEDFVETRNDRVVSVTMIPFIRARTIEVDATNLKPNTNHFFFFDNMRVDAYTRPYNADYSTDGGTTVASNLKSDGNGRLRGYFELPNSAAQRFPTGQRELKLTSSFYNLSNPTSAGSAIYQAQGLLQASQTEIVSTRNGRVVLERLQGERSISRRGSNLNSSETDTQAPDIPVDTTPPVFDTVADTSSPEADDPEPEADEVAVVVPDQAPIVFVEPETVTTLPIAVVSPAPQVPIIPQEVRPNFLMIPDRESRLNRGWADPLAQSFLVDANGGMSCTSVDLHFKTKSIHMPVSVQIRTMVNGYPGQTVLPFSTVTLNPGDVNISADGSVATTFTFTSPVFVEESHEYCIVVYSNSNEYEAWISRMGETDLVTSQTISGQPYAGSLFLSQNASTWTAEQTDDLKFNLKIASFDITKTPNIKFENAALPYSTLQENPIEVTSGSNTIRVSNYLHGLYDATSRPELLGVEGDKAGAILSISSPTLSGGTPADGSYLNEAITSVDPTGGSGATIDIVITNSGADVAATISNPGQGYTAADTLTITDFNGNVDLTITVATVGETLGGIPVDAIGGATRIEYTGGVANIGIDTFRCDVSLTNYIGANKLKTGYTANASTTGGGSSVTCNRDYYFDALHTLIPAITQKNTQILTSVQTTSMKTPEGVLNTGDVSWIGDLVYTRRSTNQFVTLNDNSFFARPSVVASPINETRSMNSSKSFQLTMQMLSFNTNLSPIIDVETIGCLGIANRINNIDSSSDVPTGTTYVASTEPDGDNNAMVYVTRKVSLKTPATSLKVLSDNFRPANTELKVLYKILRNDDSTPFDDVGFEYFNTTGGPDTAIETDSKNFKEYEYTATELDEFSAFAIKIVGQGSNTSVVPIVSALRCMALA